MITESFLCAMATVMVWKTCSYHWDIDFKITKHVTNFGRRHVIGTYVIQNYTEIVNCSPDIRLKLVAETQLHVH